ncbi:MAG: type II toxin-antitoxin system Phd/YefM family antitoxin [Rhizobiales bacterium]|nr:type II toxin-antitoxin system Phd/YefM family antitoxin [Hyphomicrobiales bacterium]
MNKHTRSWSLQEAKAKFSEVVRRAQTEGPQTVTVHGKVAVQIVPVPNVSSGLGAPSVDDIVKAFQACPVKDFDVPRIRTHGRFRDVDL